MKKLTDWLFVAAAVIAVMFAVAASVLPPKSTPPDPALAEIRAELVEIKAAVGRTETTVGWVYDFESYQVWLQDWRSTL
ncbi:MAG: hypothetical protein M0P69_13680 [Bacteroidales bacterium]|nr:hypothetical protein [Bacteroidales bacterium]